MKRLLGLLRRSPQLKPHTFRLGLHATDFTECDICGRPALDEIHYSNVRTD